MYVQDNYDRYELHEAEQERFLRRLPVCSVCGEHMQQAKAIRFKGQWYCNTCEDEALELIAEDYREEIEV